MIIHTIADLGAFGTNCYILETSDKNAIIIDAPYSGEIISSEIDRLGLSLKNVLLTHGHCDHIEAVGGLVDKYGCEVFISEHDAKMLEDRRLCLAEYFNSEFSPFCGVKTVKDGDVIALDDISLSVLHTPGHSPGSVCYVAEDCIFTGDTLFEGTVGRVDFLGSDWQKLLSSLEKIYCLGKNYIIYPGHGGKSDLDAELRYNSYLDHIRARM